MNHPPFVNINANLNNSLTVGCLHGEEVMGTGLFHFFATSYVPPFKGAEARRSSLLTFGDHARVISFDFGIGQLSLEDDEEYDWDMDPDDVD